MAAALPDRGSDVLAKSPTTWRDRMPVHPAADLFPMMSNDELLALGEDIKARGLAHSITLWRDADGGYSLLDGRNRLDAMELVGMTIIAGDGTTLEAKLADHVLEATSIIAAPVNPYEFVISANVHRRHLTAEGKRKVIADLIKAQPDKSALQISKMVKASPHTVIKVKDALVAKGDVCKVQTSTDTKGRKQPVKKGRRVNPKSAPKPDPARSITTCLSAVRIAVEVALVAKRGDAEHQSLVFENVRRCLAEMEQARLGGTP